MLRHGLPTAAGPQGTPPLQGGTIRFLTMAANPVILHPSPNSLHERLGRFERRDGVRRNDHRRILRDIAGYFLRSLFDDKTAETAQINILSAGHRLLHTFHERFHDVENNRFSQSPLFGNLGNDISFCHSLILFQKFHSAAKDRQKRIITFFRQVFSAFPLTGKYGLGRHDHFQNPLKKQPVANPDSGICRGTFSCKPRVVPRIISAPKSTYVPANHQ